MIRALPTTLRERGPWRIDFLLSDRSRRVKVSGRLEGANTALSLGDRIVSGRSGRVLSLLAERASEFAAEVGFVPQRACVTATDAWGNVGRESCAAVRVR